MTADRIILHSDLNNFYATVECRGRPDLAGQPVAVCGDVKMRHGIVLAKNQEAKACGIVTGEAVAAARARCPGLVVLPPDMEKYMSFSRAVRDLYGEFTTQVESFGLDECWLDVTGSTRLFGSGREIADKIRSRVKSELGLSVSVGVSYNKVFAKMGSDYKKPDATTEITRDNYRTLLWRLPVGELLFIGRATSKKLWLYGIRTIGDLAAADVRFLYERLGKNGIVLWRYANGMDCTPVMERGDSHVIKSIGNCHTPPRDLLNEDDVSAVMRVLCDSVAGRLRDAKLKCTTVQISVRDTYLKWYERQCKTGATSLSRDLHARAMSLFRAHHTDGRPIRTIGVRGCGLVPEGEVQLSLFGGEEGDIRAEALERSADAIRTRYGGGSLTRGVALGKADICNFEPYGENIMHADQLFRVV